MSKFLSQMEKRPIVARACRVAGISRQTAYHYREMDADFAALWEQSRQNGIDALEEIAWQRAEEVSDTLMIFLLKGQRAEVYRETLRHDLVFGRMSEDELDAYITRRLAEAGQGSQDRPGAQALASIAGSGDKAELDD